MIIMSSSLDKRWRTQVFASTDTQNCLMMSHLRHRDNVIKHLPQRTPSLMALEPQLKEIHREGTLYPFRPEWPSLNQNDNNR